MTRTVKTISTPGAWCYIGGAISMVAGIMILTQPNTLLMPWRLQSMQVYKIAGVAGMAIGIQGIVFAHMSLEQITEKK